MRRDNRNITSKFKPFHSRCVTLSLPKMRIIHSLTLTHHTRARTHTHTTHRVRRLLAEGADLLGGREALWCRLAAFLTLRRQQRRLVLQLHNKTRRDKLFFATREIFLWRWIKLECLSKHNVLCLPPQVKCQLHINTTTSHTVVTF